MSTPLKLPIGLISIQLSVHIIDILHAPEPHHMVGLLVGQRNSHSLLHSLELKEGRRVPGVGRSRGLAHAVQGATK